MITLSYDQESGITTLTVPKTTKYAEKTFELNFDDPAQLIRQMDALGAHLTRYALDVDTTEILNNKSSAPTLFAAIKYNIRAMDEADREQFAKHMHALNVAWIDRTYNDKEQTKHKLKANIRYSSRHHINLARLVLNELLQIELTETPFKEDKDKQEALTLLEQYEAAIKGYETRFQTALRYVGYFFGSIFAITQGGNNGKSIAAAVIAVSVMVGVLGLSLTMPIVWVPAAIIGVGSLLINATVAVNASGNAFKNLFGRDRLFETLYQYKDASTGKRHTFSKSQTAGFLIGGLAPTFFSAFCLSALGGYVLTLAFSSIAVLAPIALPLALAITISCATALFFVYLEDSAALFHFPETDSKGKELKGLHAVKTFLKDLVFPTRQITARVDAEIQRRISEGTLEAKSDQETKLREKLTTRSKRLAPAFILLGVTGVAFTMAGAALAVPVLLPFISLPIAFAIAFLAIPGQLPFYAGAATSLSAKLMIAIEQRNDVQSTSSKAPEEKSGADAELTLSQRDRAEQARSALHTPTVADKFKERASHAFGKVAVVVMSIAKALNPPGNGGLAVVAFLGVALAMPMLIPILVGAFITASFASASVGYTRDGVGDTFDPKKGNDNRFKDMFTYNEARMAPKKVQSKTPTDATLDEGAAVDNDKDKAVDANLGSSTATPLTATA